jgi:arylsulfatase A-like enzyme
MPAAAASPLDRPDGPVRCARAIVTPTCSAVSSRRSKRNAGRVYNPEVTQSRLRLLLFGALVVGLASGCARSRVPLWQAEWSRHHMGEWWERGVAPGDREHFEARRGGTLWRARALNPADREGVVRVSGPQGDRTWRLAAGGVADLEWAIERPGAYAVDVSPGVILGQPRLVRPRTNAPLVVLLLADTLRGDRVNETLTPSLLAAFRTGRRYTEAMSNASWTLPSVASVFTSRPVLELSAVDGGLIAIPEGIATWAEVLDAHGFTGGAVVANFTVNVPNDFGKGFDSFVVPMKFGPEGHPPAEWVLAQARRWLRAHRGEPGFLYLHFMDQHEPYHDREGGMPKLAPLTPLASRAREASPEETRERREAYDATVRYLDRELGPFLAELPPQAIVAFTADHGEAFGEHGCWGHGLNLYHEAVHVPLLLRGPGVSTGVDRRPVQLLDLAPTLLDLAGCRVAPGMVGRSLRRGGSGAPLVAATFGGGPLRWLWRAGSREVLVRTRPQPGLAPEAESKMIEVKPLPNGAFAFDLERDPGEEHPRPLDDTEAVSAARVFAATAGRLVPGLQVLSVARRGPTVVAFTTPAPVRVAQVFSVSGASVAISGGRVEVRWDNAFPFALAAFTAPEGARPAVAGGVAWRWFSAADAARIDAPGAFLWFDRRSASVQRGYEETIVRLRNLGYLQ